MLRSLAIRTGAYLLTVVLLGTAASLAQATEYTFTNIADNSESFSDFFSASINDSGTVAFWALLEAGGSGIFTGAGGPTTTIADSSGPFSHFDAVAVSPYRAVAASINDSGTVAFWAGLDAGGSGIFTGNGAVLTTIATGDFVGGAPSINANGTVAFRATLDDEGMGIFTSAGGALTKIAGGQGFGPPSINASGTVAFRARLDEEETGIFTGTGGPLTTIAKVDASAGLLLGNVSINDGGTVAFYDEWWEPSGCVINKCCAMYTGDGGPLTTILERCGSFSQLGPPSINNSGTLAFWASLDGGGSGIFTRPDPVADMLIAVGDPLFGSIVTDVCFEEWNNYGQIAFRYSLDNGRRGIGVATPIPEPSTLVGLLNASLVALLVYAWRRGRQGAYRRTLRHRLNKVSRNAA